MTHGEEDDSLPASDARELVDAHGSPQLSPFDRACQPLQHDLRAIAVLLDWRYRMRSVHKRRCAFEGWAGLIG
jgi:putative redox protein